jgi:hypothetical protein
MTVNALHSKQLKTLSIYCELTEEIVKLDYSDTDKKYTVRMFDFKEHMLKQRLSVDCKDFWEAMDLLLELTQCDEGVTITPEELSHDAVHWSDRNLDCNDRADKGAHEEEGRS